jgi:hypothetical protein
VEKTRAKAYEKIRFPKTASGTALSKRCVAKIERLASKPEGSSRGPEVFPRGRVEKSGDFMVAEYTAKVR